MVNWISTIMWIYQILQITINTLRASRKIRGIMRKDYVVTEVKEHLQSGELHFGDRISIVGTFSEYIPFIDPRFILRRTIPYSEALTHTARLQPINDVYCGALFLPDQSDAFAKETIPIFYDTKSSLLEYSTGQMIEMKCRVVQIPNIYRDIIKESDYFTFERDDGTRMSFGLEVLKVEPYGLVDSFRINAWIVGNLNPPPKYKLKKQTCFNCVNCFSFMKIDPVDFPPKYGCASPRILVAGQVEKEQIRKWTREFFELEKSGVPHVIFPDVFTLFKVIYPYVDIYNDEQIKYVRNVLAAALKMNIQSLFKYVGVFPGFKIPKQIQCNLDFQYDQRAMITEQTFDPTKIPRWECPHYEPRKTKQMTET